MKGESKARTAGTVTRWHSACFMALLCATAQADAAEVVGVVSSGGSLVRGERVVTLQPTSGGATHTIRTDSNGRFKFVDIPPGLYLLRCRTGQTSGGQRVQIQPGLNNFNCTL